jgi:ribokinase
MKRSEVQAMCATGKPIVVVGSINMDLVARTPRIPLAGQTLIGSGFDTTPGGKGANQAVAAGRLSYPVHMAGRVGAAGQDAFGQALIDSLVEAGVGTAAVERVPGSSGIASILVADNGENSIVVVPGANGKFTVAAVDQHAALIRSAGMVLSQLELPLDTVSHLLALCAETGVPVMLDPAPAAPLPDETWRRVAWFTPNETEAALYLGETLPPEEGVRRLLARGLKAAWVRPFHVEAVDTVGAGDCFNGAFAVALLEGKDPFAAAQFASAAAAISVTRRGAQASMPTRAEVDEFLRTHQ